MTPSKDTLEVTNPASGAAVPEGNIAAKQDTSRMRADAVSLELPVKVHGSRVKDIVRGTTPHTEPFEEQSSTMIVFPQGGVLKLSTPVAAGQMMVVTNSRSGHDAICRVVQVRAFGQGQSYVEIEFTHRQPGYWGVNFASDRSDAAITAAPVAPAAPPVSVEVKVEKAEEKPATPVSWAPASSLKAPTGNPPGQAGKQDSAFAQIGSQEEVQPAASSTTRVRSIPARDTDRKGLVAEAARKSLLADLPPAAPATPAASVSMADLQGDSRAGAAISFAGVPGEAVNELPAEISRSADASTSPFGRLAASAALSGAHVAREPFGSLGSASESSESKGGGWLKIAAGVAALLAVGAAGAYFLHAGPFAAKTANSSAVISAPSAPAAETTAQPAPAAEPANRPSAAASQPPVSAPALTAAPLAATHVTEPAPPASRSNRPAPSPVVATAPVEQKPAAKAPNVLAALNAHPTARTHSSDSGQPEAAPSLDGAGSENGGLPALASSVSLAPPVPEQPQGPVRIRVGGALKPPRLVSSVLPAYPPIARETGIEGDVVVDTTIDSTGKVTEMKVISGPPVLRQSALDALRQWKYAPSMLNGQPIPVQMTVTLKFHRS